MIAMLYIYQFCFSLNVLLDIESIKLKLLSELLSVCLIIYSYSYYSLTGVF